MHEPRTTSTCGTGTRYLVPVRAPRRQENGRQVLVPGTVPGTGTSTGTMPFNLVRTPADTANGVTRRAAGRWKSSIFLHTYLWNLVSLPEQARTRGGH